MKKSDPKQCMNLNQVKEKRSKSEINLNIENNKSQLNQNIIYDFM